MSVTASLAGVFTHLRKQSLIGDTLSHAIFPGIGIGFLIAGERNWISIFIGALLFGSLAWWLIQILSRDKKVGQDPALALILSSFFSVGIVILVLIQNLAIPGQAGLDKLLFGSAATIIPMDLWFFSGGLVLCFFILILFGKVIFLSSFDSSYAEINGFSNTRIDGILGLVILLAVVTGIQAMGVILVAALMIIPALISRYWSQSVRGLILISIAVALGAGLIGAYLSTQGGSSPTGPWIVIILGVMAFVSLVFSPNRGILASNFMELQSSSKIRRENLLKDAYKKDGYLQKTGSILNTLDSWLLKRSGFVFPIERTLKLTEKGFNEGERIVRLHRLWELYLTRNMNIAPDHVHEDAEAVEHMISDEIEQNLIQVLGAPESDPHQQKIPY